MAISGKFPVAAVARHAAGGVADDGERVDATVAMDYPSVEALTTFLLDTSGLPVERAAVTAGDPAAPDDVERLNQEDLFREIRADLTKEF